MSEFIQKPSQGVLFRNKKSADNQPDYKGTVTLPDGKKMELAGWIKKHEKGDFITLKIQEPREKKEPF